MSPRAQPEPEVRLDASRTWVQWPLVSSLVCLAAMVAWYGSAANTQLVSLKQALEEQAAGAKEQAKEVRVVQQQISAIGARLDRVEHALDRR